VDEKGEKEENEEEEEEEEEEKEEENYEKDGEKEKGEDENEKKEERDKEKEKEMGNEKMASIGNYDDETRPNAHIHTPATNNSSEIEKKDRKRHHVRDERPPSKRHKSSNQTPKQSEITIDEIAHYLLDQSMNSGQNLKDLVYMGIKKFRRHNSRLPSVHEAMVLKKKLAALLDPVLGATEEGQKSTYQSTQSTNTKIVIPALFTIPHTTKPHNPSSSSSSLITQTTQTQTTTQSTHIPPTDHDENYFPWETKPKSKPSQKSNASKEGLILLSDSDDEVGNF
jgi:hypothetical protein